MKPKITSVHFKIDNKLENFITDKVTKIDFLEGIISTDIVLKLEGDEKIKDKTAEIRIKIKGNDLFAKKTTKSFEQSITESVDAIKKQATKKKEKRKRI